MNKRILLSLLASVVIGTAITLISGLTQTPMAHLGVDVVYWGIPLSWTMRVILTSFQSIDFLNLIADLVTDGSIGALMLFVVVVGAN